MQYPLERKKQQFLKFSTTNRSVLAAGRENSLRLFTCWRNTTRVPSHQQGELYSSTSSGIHSHSLSVKGLSPQSQTARASHQRHARWFSPSWARSRGKGLKSPRDPGRGGQRGAGAAKQRRKRCLGRAAAAEGGGGLAAAGGEEGSPHERAIEKGRAAERPGWRRRACAPRGLAPSPSPSHLTRGKPSAHPPTRLLGGPSWQSTRRGTEGVPGARGGPAV